MPPFRFPISNYYHYSIEVANCTIISSQSNDWQSGLTLEWVWRMNSQETNDAVRLVFPIVLNVGMNVCRIARIEKKLFVLNLKRQDSF